MRHSFLTLENNAYLYKIFNYHITDMLTGKIMVTIGAIAAAGISIIEVLDKVNDFIKKTGHKKKVKVKRDEINKLREAKEELSKIRVILDQYVEWYHNFTTLSLTLEKLDEFIGSNQDILRYNGNDPVLIAKRDFAWTLLEMHVDDVSKIKNTSLIRITKNRERFFNEKDKGDLKHQYDEFKDRYIEFKVYMRERRVGMLNRRSEQLKDRAQSMEGIMKDCIDTFLSP